MSSLIYYYPIDLTGRSSTNRTIREPHLLVDYQGVDYKVISLTHGGFYTRDLRIYDSNNQELRPYQDYVATFVYEDASYRTGLEVCGAIVFLNPTVTGTVFVNAQMVGGDLAFTIDARQRVLDHLTDHPGDVPTWAGIVGEAQQWGPGELEVELWDKKGYQIVTTELSYLAQAIKAGDQNYLMEYRANAKELYDNYIAEFGTEVEDHDADTDNPHQTTKNQVGLGNIHNYPITVPNPEDDNGGGPSVDYTYYPPTQWDIVPYDIGPWLNFYCVAYHDGLYVGGSTNGTLWSSTDGFDWTERTTTSLNSDTVYSVAYGDGLWVAVGWSGLLMTSPDGINWTLQPKFTTGGPIEYTGLKVAYHDDNWVIVTAGNAVYHSTDGLAWALVLDADEDFQFKALAYGDGVWVIGGDNTPIYYSSDAINWVEGQPVFTDGGVCRLEDIAYGNGHFMAVGNQMIPGSPPAYTSLAATSPDGVTWIEHPTPAQYRHVAFGGGCFTAVGYTGLYSTPAFIGVSVLGTDWITDEISDHDVGNGFDLIYVNGRWSAYGANRYLYYAEVDFNDPQIWSTGGGGGVLPPPDTPLDEVDNTSYMTPYSTRRAIAKHAQIPLDDHIEDVDNPHEVTAAQANVMPSTQIDGLADTKLDAGDTAVDTGTLVYGTDIERYNYTQLLNHLRANIPTSGLTDGVLNTARIALGTAGPGTLLRGDGQWVNIQSMVNQSGVTQGTGVYFIGYQGNDATALSHINVTYGNIQQYPVGTIVLYRINVRVLFFNFEYAGEWRDVNQLRAAVRQATGWSSL